MPAMTYKPGTDDLVEVSQDEYDFLYRCSACYQIFNKIMRAPSKNKLSTQDQIEFFKEVMSSLNVICEKLNVQFQQS